VCVLVTSDPHAWLRPFFARLQAHPAFRQFAPSHQFNQLVQAVERDHPSRAASMREWSVAAQHALLGHLAMMVEQSKPESEVELWRVRKADRELRCVAVHLPTGIDVRLLDGTALDAHNFANLPLRSSGCQMIGETRF
jgi:hypothetical protein